MLTDAGRSGWRGSNNNNTQAAGGVGEGGAAGNGGGGGYDSQPDGDPGLELCANDHGSDSGGGGGAQGRIRINAVTPYAPNCVLSPAPGTPAWSTGSIPTKPLPTN